MSRALAVAAAEGIATLGTCARSKFLGTSRASAALPHGTTPHTSARIACNAIAVEMLLAGFIEVPLWMTERAERSPRA